MSSSDMFFLQWKDFETNLSQGFNQLREENELLDVTLVCDDSQIQAHRVILSACSPFFKRVLGKNSHPQPLIYIKGVKLKELQNVLDFMYLGKVTLSQTDLTSFLYIAQDLKVKGIERNEPTMSTSEKNEETFNLIKPLENIASLPLFQTFSALSSTEESKHTDHHISSPNSTVKASKRKTKMTQQKNPNVIKNAKCNKSPPKSMETMVANSCTEVYQQEIETEKMNTDTEQMEDEIDTTCKPQTSTDVKPDYQECSGYVLQSPWENVHKRKECQNVEEMRPQSVGALDKKVFPKMREGRAIVEGKPENLVPLGKISEKGSKCAPKWQCNMCKRIFPTREETVKHLQAAHMISKTSIYFKSITKIV